MRGARKTRILFVCGGNTCRSPMAAAIANAKYRGVLVAESAGTAAWEADANRLAVEVLRDRFGIQLRHHRPRDVQTIDVEGFDLVVAVDRSVAAELPQVQSGRLRVWAVRDPYLQGRAAYEAAADEILREIENLVAGSCPLGGPR